MRNSKCMSAKSVQSYPALCDPMDCSPLGPSVHGILQAGTLEWVPRPPPGILLSQDIPSLHLLLWHMDSLQLDPPGILRNSTGTAK